MESPLTHNINPDREPLSLAEYRETGGYAGLRTALDMTPRQVQEEVTRANLLGRGGAGFPTGMKWSVVPTGEAARTPTYFIVNADEMEPGTMKDRLLLEGDPHQVIEGAIISAYAIGASIAYIFLRWAYKLAELRLRQALEDAYTQHYLGENILGTGYSLDMSLHMSAGRYMCGEETGLLNALEGKRAIPRAKPPFPQVSGLFGMPTVVNNVETVCCVPHILQHGAAWFRGLSRSENSGTKLYGASGRVKRPGLWELPLGVTAREILEEHAGGMRAGYRFRGLLPGGASTAFLTEEHLDLPMDFNVLETVGSRLGTGTMIVMDDSVCPVGVLISLLRFFAHESCGWCTPCREGLPWVRNTLEAIEAGGGQPADLDVLEHHVRTIKIRHTFCALAPGAMAPLESALRAFRPDFERHIAEHRCPWS